MSEDAPARLPTHLVVAGLLRQVAQAGGFAMVLAKGEPSTGALLVLTQERGLDTKAYEQMPRPDGQRLWHLARAHNPDQPHAFDEWVARRRAQDPDLWVIELDIAEAERFIGFSGNA